MFGSFKNTKKQGDAGLGHAIAYFCSHGIPVCIPLTDSQDYDLVVDMDGDLKKVQVKTTTFLEDSGHYCVSLKLAGGNSKVNYIHKRADELVYDHLFVVTSQLEFYLIPRAAFVNHRSAIVLGPKWSAYKVQCGVEASAGIEPALEAFAAPSVPISPTGLGG